MKKLVIITIIFIVNINLGYSQDFFNQVDSFLGKHVNEGLVDYSAIKESSEELENLVSLISSFQTAQLESSAQKAFFINAYNILVIKGIIEDYPINSPLDKEGFFDKIKYNVAGEKLTLNEIENDKLREEFKDSRIHFVLVCAAIGCPKLISKGYFPKTVESQIQLRTEASLNDQQFIRINQDRIEISEIFKWYSDDFGGKDNYRNFINTYRKDALPLNSSIGFYTYDWKLNVKK